MTCSCGSVQGFFSIAYWGRPNDHGADGTRVVTGSVTSGGAISGVVGGTGVSNPGIVTLSGGKFPVARDQCRPSAASLAPDVNSRRI